MQPMHKLLTLAGLCLIGQLAASIVVGLTHGWIAGITTAVALHFALGYAMRPWACRWHAEWVAQQNAALAEFAAAMKRIGERHDR